VGTPVHRSQPVVDTVDSRGDGDEETVELVQQNLESDLTRNVLDWLRTSVLYTPVVFRCCVFGSSLLYPVYSPIISASFIDSVTNHLPVRTTSVQSFC